MWLRAWSGQLRDLVPPDLGDLYEVRIARFLLVVAIVACLGVGGYCVATLLFAPEPAHTYVLAGAYFAGAAGVVIAIRRGALTLASHLFVLTNLVPATIFLVVEGPHTGHFGVLFIVVLVAGMLLRGRATVIYGVLAVGAFAATQAAAKAGLITQVVPPTEAVWAQHLSQLIVASVVAAFLGSSLHRALGELRSSEANLARLVNHSPDGIMSLDDDGRCVAANAAAARMFGFEVDDMVGQSLPELGFDAALVADRDALMGIVEHEVGARVLELNGCSIDDGGDAIGVELIVRDVTAQHEARREKHRLETNLRRSQRLESLGRLTGGVAHDFNNLLAVIMGNVELIALESELPPHVVNALDEVTEASERAAAVTRQLLTFGRAPAREPAAFDLCDTVQRAERLFRRFLGERVDLVVCCDEPAYVMMSPAQLDQVLMNLVLNAQDAMPDGGRLELRVESRDDSQVCLIVADDGAGMTEQVKRQLFEPFFSTKEAKDNAGLGMAVVKQLIDDAGGRIDVDSEPGRGTTFSVLLPRVEPPSSPDDRTETAATTLRGKALYLDDDDAVRPTVTGMLRSLGLEAWSARDGDEAAAEIAKRSVDVLVTDVVLAQESGPEVAARLQESHPDLRVLYVSGYAAGHLEGVPEDAPFLAKPLTRRGLSDKLRGLLDADET